MTRIAITHEVEAAPVSRRAQATVTVETTGAGPVDITPAIDAWLTRIEAATGAVNLFLRHTSASLTIQENADPDVLEDLADALDRLAPAGAPYRHGSEGPDDMPAHIKTMLTETTLTIPVSDGRLALGTWQAVYLLEHRTRPHLRTVTLTYLGD